MSISPAGRGPDWHDGGEGSAPPPAIRPHSSARPSPLSADPAQPDNYYTHCGGTDGKPQRKATSDAYSRSRCGLRNAECGMWGAAASTASASSSGAFSRSTDGPSWTSRLVRPARREKDRAGTGRSNSRPAERAPAPLLARRLGAASRGSSRERRRLEVAAIDADAPAPLAPARLDGESHRRMRSCKHDVRLALCLRTS